MERNLRKTRVGVVVSDKMDKTIVVAVKDSVQHPLYKKILKRTKKFKAHDENNEAGIGDRVEIMETRKISKEVNWRLVKIIEKANNQPGTLKGGPERWFRCKLISKWPTIPVLRS